MDRVFESGAVGSPPSAPASPSTGYTTAGNPSTATPATKPGPYWFHQITEELRAVIVGAGLTPSHTNLEQLKEAIDTLINAGKGLGSSGIVLLNATTTLTNAAHVGKTVLFDSTATGAFTVTLPLANTVATGRRIHFHNVSSFNVTVQRQGSNLIYPNGASINSIVVGPGDTLTVEAYGGTSWFAVGGSVQLPFSKFVSPSIGVSQSWQNVTASRAFNTNYYNTTGKPILVSINLYNGGGASVGLLVGGQLIGTCYQPGIANGYAQLTAIVPDGASYSCGGTTLGSWFELRS